MPGNLKWVDFLDITCRGTPRPPLFTGGSKSKKSPPSAVTEALRLAQPKGAPPEGRRVAMFKSNPASGFSLNEGNGFFQKDPGQLFFFGGGNPDKWSEFCSWFIRWLLEV